MTAAHTDLGLDYVEFNVSDMARTKDFYARAFGWTYTDFGPDYCEFTDGVRKGGFDATLPPRPGGPLIVLYAFDLENARQRVEKAGGTISKPVFEFPGGRRFHFTDPDGYELAVWTEVG